MPTSYSPIDEPSFTDTAFDAEEVLNGPASQPARPQTPSQPYSKDTAPTQAQPQAAPAAAPATSQTSSPAESAAPRRRPRAGIARTLQLVRDSRTVMFIGLVFTILAGYMLIVTISYFANIGSDQSAMLNGDFDPTMIRNAGGPFGAWIAHTLLYNWLGIGSFLLIYYLAVCGLSMLRVYRPPFWALTMRCLLTAVALSIVCGLVTYEFASPVYWGGRHGHLLNDRLITLTGIWGALGTSIIMGGLVIILYLTELKRIYGVASQGIRAYNERQAQRRAERERIREAEEAERLAREAAAEAERKAEEARQQAAMAAQRAQQQAESAETAQAERMTATAAPAATAISMGGPVATATAANVVPATDVRTESLFPEQTIANPDSDVQDEAEEME
ncbi:MAG: DNA translocase FtsK 4TM domain-containing protein, partial [Duncaniella sp.]|nr:DNA translocase FtsK 4TM domain-containing protein [Duncaniella sp.]